MAETYGNGNTTVSISGLEEFLSEIEKRYGSKQMDKLQIEALNLSGRVAVVNLKNAVGKYANTGATRDEVVAGKPKWGVEAGTRAIKVGFAGNGSGQRWRLVHLNEFGYTPHGFYAGRSNATDSNGNAFYKPTGFHAIQDAFEQMKPQLKKVQIAALKKGLL